jgi:hypothetical protein
MTRRSGRGSEESRQIGSVCSPISITSGRLQKSRPFVVRWRDAWPLLEALWQSPVKEDPRAGKIVAFYGKAAGNLLGTTPTMVGAFKSSLPRIGEWLTSTAWRRFSMPFPDTVTVSWTERDMTGTPVT